MKQSALRHVAHLAFAIAAAVILGLGWLLHNATSQTAVIALVAALSISFLILAPAYAGFVVLSQARDRADRRLSDMADHLPGVAFRARMDSDLSNPHFEFVSAAVADVLGIEREALLRDAGEFGRRVAKEDLAGLLSSIQKSAHTLETLLHDFRFNHARGRTVWLRSSTSVRKEPDGTFLWNGYVADVSKQKELRFELLEAKEAAEQANRAKSFFLATMSHEYTVRR